MQTINTQLKISMASLLSAALFLSFGVSALASSHREAPLISGDPKVDATDLYAFVSPDNADTVTLIANYIPFEEPAGGPNFDSFDDNALYAINIDNNGDAVPDVVYQFKFKTTIENPNTFLYNTGPITSDTDPNWNIKQTYTLTKIAGSVSTVLGTDMKMPPVNIGPKSTPNYSALQAEAFNTLPGGGKVFAGQSDDPFFVDLGSLFDLLSIRTLPGNAGGGVNTTQGFNVHSLVIQVPITDLTSNHTKPTMATDTAAVIGVWTTSSRQATRVLNSNGSQTNTGPWVQVSRLGSPLVNEVVVPVGSKDLFNASNPVDDAQFANGVANPEVGTLLNAIYGINTPPQGNFGTANERDDLEAIFLTGIPGLTKPATGVPAELLRLNVAIPSTVSPNKLGVLGGDNQGYPNGRRLGDDVVDISLRAIAGAAYPLFHPGFTPDATGVQLGDGVDGNDKAFRGAFPYLALPFRGYESVPHGTQASVTPPSGTTTPPMGTTTPPTGTTTPPTGSTTPGMGSISGTFYDDDNYNESKDSGETGIMGFLVNLYHGFLYNGTPVTTTTDSNGMYSFANLADGTYAVEQITMDGWHQDTADYGALTITAGALLTDIDFANSMCEAISSTTTCAGNSNEYWYQSNENSKHGNSTMKNKTHKKGHNNKNQDETNY